MIKTTSGIPEFCEYCGAKLEMDGPLLICPNSACPNKFTEKLKAWLLNVAPIPGLVWKTIERLLNELNWNDCENISQFYLNKLYRLPAPLEGPFMNVTNPNSEKGLFNQMCNKLVKGNVSISSFFLGLNIPGLGKVGAKAIENSGKGLDIIFNLENDVKPEETEDMLINLLQDKNVAHSLIYDEEINQYFKSCIVFVYTNLSDDSNKDTTKVEVTPDKPIEKKGHVVITGKLSVKRDVFISEVEAAGWEVKNKVTADTAYLITDNPYTGTSKNRDADKFGVKKITEEEFRCLM